MDTCGTNTHGNNTLGEGAFGNDAGLASPGEAEWAGLLRREPDCISRAPLYAPLLHAAVATPSVSADGCFVLGRIAQTLDGRIATSNGASFWISGPDDILHSHRLRALFDAIVVGGGTAQADDPLLTTRFCSGPSPVRVILDAQRRLLPSLRVFAGGPPTLLVVAPEHAQPGRHGEAEVVAVPRAAGSGLDLAELLKLLAGRGLSRVFVEGGGVTVSRFLAAGLLDRLHVTIAPLLLGEGIPAFTLPGCQRPQDGMRLSWTVHRLGADLLLDIPLDRARPASCP